VLSNSFLAREGLSRVSAEFRPSGTFVERLKTVIEPIASRM
jgi:hypothetical protein